MINHDIIEEHPINPPAPWVSNIVIKPKSDRSLRMTLDARNVNKAIIPTNQPIPRYEDINLNWLIAHFSQKWNSNQPFGKLS